MVYKTSQLMLHTDITAVSSGIHTKHINTLREPNSGFENVNTGGTRSNQRANEVCF